LIYLANHFGEEASSKVMTRHIAMIFYYINLLSLCKNVQYC